MDKFYQDLQKQVKHLRLLLKNDNRILLITHRGCMDGHGCKMLMEKTFDNVFTVKLSPQEQSLPFLTTFYFHQNTAWCQSY